MTMPPDISRRLPIQPASRVQALLLLTCPPVAAHGGPVPAGPSGLTTEGRHVDMAPVHRTVSPRVRPVWDEPDDTSFTRYRVLRRDADANVEGRITVIDGDTGPDPVF